MSDVTSKDKRPDEAKEQRRRVIEDALLAFRPEVVDEFGELLGREVPPPEQALENLAAASVHRVLKHRLLIDGLRRGNEDGLEALDDPVRHVLDATLGEDLDTDMRRARVEEAKGHLDAVVADDARPRRLHRAHWEQWVARTDHLYGFSTHEATFQACDDERLFNKRRPDGRLVQSRLIVAEFWSSQPPTAFARYIDPSNWPRCSAFWRAMTEVPPRTSIDGGYDCDFEETVAILGQTLTVPLQVAFRVRPDQSRVWTRFNLARGRYTASVPVDVDTGTVSAESMPGGQGRTLVRATKYLHWSDPSRPDLTMLACDFGWSELMIEMADACREGFPATTSGGPATTAGTSVDDAVRRFVEEVTTEYRHGVGDCQPHLQDLIGRFTGPSWDARWINDLLAMGQVTANRSGRIASHVRRFADSLKDADDPGGTS